MVTFARDETNIVAVIEGGYVENPVGHRRGGRILEMTGLAFLVARVAFAYPLGRSGNNLVLFDVIN